MKYRVEIFQDNNWVKWSTHGRLKDAVFNAERVSESRKCDFRIIHKGDIVMAYYRGKGE